MPERLQKVLSQWGIASRRRAEVLIQQGQVTVNGQLAQLGQKVEPDKDEIAVDGMKIHPQQRPDYHYLLLHKPPGVVSTCFDPEGRSTVLDYLDEDLHQAGIYPVGRLDAYSTGALLLTNDGDFTYRLTHPKHDVSKTYEVWLEGVPPAADLATWRRGIELEGRLTRPSRIRVLNQASPRRTLLEVVLWEGRNRQIRRVAQALGHRVLSLHRTAIGPVNLGQLAPGLCRPLSSSEVTALLAEADISATGREADSQLSVQSTRY
jgi:pseudouridine synthase